LNRYSFDVAVVGGGPAGAAAAIRLARAGLRVAVIAADDGDADKIGESLAPSARMVLERIGLWEQHRAAGHRPCYANRSSWGGDEIDSYDFLRDPHGHGWHLDRRRFETMLADEATRAGCRWLSRTRVESLARSRDGWRVGITTAALPTDIAGRFVIDATGRSSRIARSQGARRVFHDHLVALTAFLTPDGEPVIDGATLIEAVADGWWYSAGLPDGRLVCAFMTDPDLLRRSGGAGPAAWMERLARSHHTRTRVEAGGHRLAVSPAVASAASAILDPLAGAGWVAAGDAAAAYDPLSSHGIATALATGWDAAATVLATLDGDPEAADAYGHRVRRGFAGYLDARAAYYELEERWPDAPFWQRRRRHGPRYPHVLTFDRAVGGEGSSC
jgi:flavin-dependent dehydrogenase